MTWAKNKYDNAILLGDLKIEPQEKNVKLTKFLSTFKKYIVKQKTCFRFPDRPTGIDLILSNPSMSFQDTCTVETGLLNFHKLVVTVLKQYFPKQEPTIQTFRDYKIFQNDLCGSELDYQLPKFDGCKLVLEHF